MIRARQTCFCGDERAEAILLRRRRSEAVTVNEIPARIKKHRTLRKPRESRNGFFRHMLSTRNGARRTLVQLDKNNL